MNEKSPFYLLGLSNYNGGCTSLVWSYTFANDIILFQIYMTIPLHNVMHYKFVDGNVDLEK